MNSNSGNCGKNYEKDGTYIGENRKGKNNSKKSECKFIDNGFFEKFKNCGKNKHADSDTDSRKSILNYRKFRKTLDKRRNCNDYYD